MDLSSVLGTDNDVITLSTAVFRLSFALTSCQSAMNYGRGNPDWSGGGETK